MKNKPIPTRLVKGITLLGILLLMSSFTNCDSRIKAQFMGCWTDSIEEKTASTEGRIYRPCDFKNFQPSRFRFRMELKSNGECSYLELSPTDNHQMKEGNWVFSDKTMELEILNLKGKSVRKWIVLKAGKDILQLKEF